MESMNRLPTSPSLKRHLRPLSGQMTMQIVQTKQYTNRFLDNQPQERPNSFLSKKNRCLTFQKRFYNSNKQNKIQQKSCCSLKTDVKESEKIDAKILSPSRALQYFSKIFKTEKQAVQTYKRKIKRFSNLQIQRVSLVKKDILTKTKVPLLETGLNHNIFRYKTPKVNKTFQLFDKVNVEPWFTGEDLD